MTHLTPTYLMAVEVPEGVSIAEKNGRIFMFISPDPFVIAEYTQPDSLLTLVGVWPDITEGQAANIVEKRNKKYRNYFTEGSKGAAQFLQAYVSLNSLIMSHHLDPGKRWAIIQPQ